jgi:hypothetical protein
VSAISLVIYFIAFCITISYRTLRTKKTEYFQNDSLKFCAAELDITTSSARSRRTEQANRSAAASRRRTQQLQKMEFCKKGAATQKAEF